MVPPDSLLQACRRSGPWAWLLAVREVPSTLRSVLCYDRMDTSPEKLVLDDAHKRQTEEVTNTLSQRPEGFYKSCLDQGSAVFAASCRGKTSFLGAFEHQKGGKRCL